MTGEGEQGTLWDEEPVPEAFAREEFNPAIPLHRVALAGLTAMNRDTGFDPERTHAIILLHDGQLATVAPLNYPDEFQSEAVIRDLILHVEQLAEKFGYPLLVTRTAKNGGPNADG